MNKADNMNFLMRNPYYALIDTNLVLVNPIIEQKIAAFVKIYYEKVLRLNIDLQSNAVV